MATLEELKKELAELKAKKEARDEMLEIQRERAELAKEIRDLKNPRAKEFREKVAIASARLKQQLAQRQAVANAVKTRAVRSSIARNTRRRVSVRKTPKRRNISRSYKRTSNEFNFNDAFGF